MKIAIRSFWVMVLLVLTGGNAWAQTGAWIEQPITAFGSGSRIYRAGGKCVAYTYENASKIYCFDINSSSWSEFNFSSTQHFYDILAVGNLIFAYTDSFIIAYNGITSHIDTVRFQGSPLHLAGSPDVNCSYQCGENLALFMTDERMYLFDIGVNHWQEFDYEMPADYSGVGYYWVTEDYAGVLLYRAQQQVPVNLAYSTYLQAFAQTPRGMGWAGQNEMDHGFAGIYQWLPEVDHFVAGYSAYTNQFTHITIPSDYYSEIGVVYSNRIVDEFTVWEATARKTIVPFESAYFKVACYDTRLAEWDTTTYNMNPQHETGFGGWKLGGRFAWSTVNGDADLRTLFFYSGYTGEIYTTTPGVLMAYNSLFMLEGSNVCAVNDTSNIWAYNIETGQGTMMPYARMDTRHHTGGADYLTYNRYDYSDVSTTCYYHGPSNSWSCIDIVDATYNGMAAGIHVFATFTSGDNPTVYFYSPIHNQITTTSFVAGSYLSVTAKDNMAIASGTDRTVIFDTHYNNLREFECSTTNNGIGENTVIAANSNAFTLSGYSSLNNTVTVLNLAETPYVRLTGDYIGLANIGYNGTRYYAFNSYYGNWVELIPQGNYIGATVGDKTAIVARSNYLYAFDPQAPQSVGDENEQIRLPGEIALLSNYPNPFNPSTLIDFNIARPSKVSIEIFDILGRLVDKNEMGIMPAGSHHWEWQPGDKAAGLYICKLTTDNDNRTIKMTFVK